MSDIRIVFAGTKNNWHKYYFAYFHSKCKHRIIISVGCDELELQTLKIVHLVSAEVWRMICEGQSDIVKILKNSKKKKNKIKYYTRTNIEVFFFVFLFWLEAI